MADPDHDHSDGAHKLTLDALLQTVYDSVAGQVRGNAERAMEHTRSHYFSLDPQTGQAAPRMVQIPLPGPNGTPIQRDVPLFSLVRHHDVAIDNLVLRMQLSLHEQAGADGKPGLAVSFDPAGDGNPARAEIEIRFRGVDAAEGLARINDTIVKQIGAEWR